MDWLRRREHERHRGRTGQLLSMISIILLLLGLVIVVFYAAATPGRPIRYIGVGVLTAIAALVTGCLLGFLFGIPRVVSSGELRLNKGKAGAVVTTRTPDTTVTTATLPAEAAMSTEPAPPQVSVDPRAQPAAGSQAEGDTNTDAPAPASTSSFEPSTNLSEVSDWLTKLLLGAGLVELTHLGHPLGKLINSVAYGLGRAPAGGAPDHVAQVMAGSLMLAYFVLGFLDGYVVTTLWYGSKIRNV